MTELLINTLNTHFETLQDPRKDTKNKRHDFIDILVIAVCGAISGANYWTSIADYATSKEAWFRTFLKLPNGIPSHDVFNDVFTKLDANEFEKCFIRWTSSIATLFPNDVIAVDGKTLRRSHDATEAKRSIHLVSAWSTNNSLVLGQLKTAEKSNEITAIPELLNLLSIQNCMVTIDAMGCQTEIAKTIVQKGADYFLAVKGNHPKLYGAIKSIAQNIDNDHNEKIFSTHAEVSNSGHGRHEVRRCWVLDNVMTLAHDLSDWMAIKSIVIIESERTLKNKETSIEQRFYISSAKNTAQYFIDISRAHWGIENNLHWSLDVSFREDESRVRKGDGAENFAIVRRIALNLIKKEKTNKRGIETKRLCAGWNDDYLRKVLAGLLT